MRIGGSGPGARRPGVFVALGALVAAIPACEGGGSGGGGSRGEVGFAIAQVAASIPSTADTQPEAVDTLELTFTDAGGDGRATTIEAITLRAAAANEIPDLDAVLGGAELVLTGSAVATGTISADAIAFAGLALDVPEAGSATVTLRLFWSDATGALDGLDGASMVLALAPADVAIAAGGSPILRAQATVDSGAGLLACDVEAVEIVVATQPQSPGFVGANLGPVAFRAVDENGNRDLDFPDALTLSATGGAGTLASTDAGGLTKSFASGEARWTNLTFDAPATIVVRGTATPSNFAADTASVVVNPPLDEVTYAAGAVAATLPSTVDTLGEIAEVFEIVFADAGGDGLAATVTGLTFRTTGESDITDLAAVLGGAQLFRGTTLLGTGTIAPGSIAFASFAQAIPDGGTATVSLRLFWKPDPGALPDGAGLELGLAPADVVLAGGSTLAAAQGTVESGDAAIAWAVTATELRVTTEPAGTVFIGTNMGPVAFAATDANGNVDLDFAQPVTLSREGGAGTLASTDAGGLTKSFAAGVASWANLTLDTASTIRVRATAGALSVLTAQVVVEPSLREVTFATGASAASLPSTVDTLAEIAPVFEVTFADGGADDIDATIGGLVFRTTAQNEIPDLGTALGGARLYAGGTEIATGTIGATAITFAGLSVVVPDGGAVTLNLRIFWSPATGALDGRDNDNLELSLAPAGVTIVAGSTVSLAQGTVESGDANIACAITASELRVTTEPALTSFIGVNVGPVSFVATDANGNRDDDFAESVTLAREGGSGTLASTDAGGTSKTFAAGLVSWANLTLDAAATIQVRATASPSGFTVLTRSVTVNPPLAEVTYTMPAVAASLASTVDTVGEVAEVIQIAFADAGADQTAATIAALTLRPGAGNDFPDLGAAIGGARLFQGSVPIASGAVGASTIAFTGLSVALANGGSATLSVRIFWTNTAGALTGKDGANLALGLARTDVTIAAGSTVSTSQGTVESGAGGIACAILATELRVTQQPTTPVFVTRSMGPVAFAATDANGNRDDDFAQPVTLSREGGAGTLSSSEGLTKSFAAGAVSWANLTLDAAATIQVRATSGAFSVLTQSVVVDPPLGELTYAAGAVAPSLSSTVDTAGEATSVFEVAFTDAGADDLAATITAIAFRTTAQSAVPLTALGGARLFVGPTEVAPGIIGAGAITFTGLSIAVPDGGTTTVSLRFFWTSATGALTGFDGDSLELGLARTDVGVAATGSSVAASQATVESGDGNIACAVVATELRVTQQPATPVFVTRNMAPVAFAATDANGNRDDDFAASATLSLASGSGTLASTETLTKPFVSGAVSWSDLTIDEAGTIRVRATAGGLSVDTADVVVNPPAEELTFAFQNVAAAIPSTFVTAPGEAALDIVFQNGNADGLATTIGALTIQVPLTSEITTTAIGGARLFRGADELAPATFGTASITFAGLSVTVPDGGSETLTLRIFWSAAPGSLSALDDKHLTLRLDPAGVGVAAGSTVGPAQPPVQTGTNDLALTVTATELRVTTQPTTPVFVTRSMAPVAFAATDANGNRDDDFAASVALSLASGAGTLSSSEGLTKSFAAGAVSWSDLRVDAAGTIVVRATSGTLSVDTHEVTVDPPAGEVTFAFANVAASLSSTVDAAPGGEVLQVTFTDGSGDGLGATITGFTLRAAGQNDFPDLAAKVGGARLFVGGTEVATGTVDASSIAFSGLSVAVPSGGFATASVRIFWTDADGALTGFDGANLVLALAPADVTVAALGSGVSAGQPTVSSGDGNIACAVVADRIVVTDEPEATGFVGVSFGPVAFAATDANLNVDAGFTEPVTLAREGGSGTLASTDAGSLTKTFAAGTVGWTNLTLDVAATIRVRATTGTSAFTVLTQEVAVSPAAAEVTYAFQNVAGSVPSTADTAGEIVSVFDIAFTDAGSDSLPSGIGALALRVTAANEIPPETTLGGVVLADGVTPLATGAVGQDTIDFFAAPGNALFTVPDQGTKTVTIRMFWTSASGALSGFDGKNLVLGLARTDVTIASGSGIHPQQTTAETGDGNIACTIAATKLTVTTQPTTPTFIGANFGPVAFAATDANGNRDDDFAESVTLARTASAGTTTTTDAGGFTKTFVSGAVSWANLVHDAVADVGLTATATPSGLSVSTNGVAVGEPLEEVTYAIGNAAAAVSSLVDTSGEAARIFDLTFTDAGADGVPSAVSGLTLRPGTGNGISPLSTWIGGVLLFDGDTPIATGSFSTDGGGELVSFSGFTPVAVPNGGSAALNVRVFWATNVSGRDNDDLVLALAPGDVSVASGSRVSASQGIASSGDGNLFLTIVATELRFTAGPTTPVFVGRNMGPVSLAATDANGNLDEDFAESATLDVPGGAGTLASTDAAGLTKGFSGGAVSWSDLSYDTAETIQVRATTASFTKTSGSVVVEPPLEEVTYARGTAVTSVPSIADTLGEAASVFEVVFTDAGVDDFDATISALTFRTAGANEVPLGKIAGARLFAGGASVASGAIDANAGTIAFAALSVGVPDGGDATVSVRVFFTDADDALDGLDGKSLVLELAPSDVSLAAAGSGLAGNQLEVDSGAVDLAIDATELRVAVEPPTSAAAGANFGPVAFDGTDENGNLDQSFTGTVSIVAVPPGPGMLATTDAGGLSKSATLGQVAWSDLTYSLAAGFVIRASSAGLGTVDTRAVSIEETVTLVRPGSGPAGGGNLIEIVGAGFTAQAAVTIGGDPATEVILVSATRLFARVPPASALEAASAVDVSVGTAVLSGGYRYLDDAVRPTIVTTLPATPGVNVPASTRFAFLLSEAMDPASVSHPSAGGLGSANLLEGGSLRSGTRALSEDGRWIVLDPAANLGGTSDYLAVLMSGGPAIVTDVHGLALLSSNVALSGNPGFAITVAPSQVAAADTTPPAVTGSLPTNGDDGALRFAPLVVELSEPIDPSTVRAVASPTTVVVTDQAAGATVPGRVELSGDLRAILFYPARPLAASTAHRVTITTGVQDLSGNALAAPVEIDFTTDDAVGVQADEVTPREGDLRGGDAIVISGAGFTPFSTVTIDGRACTDVRFLSGSRIACVTPPGASAGAKAVVVTTIDGVAATAATPFTYRASRGRPEVLFEYPPANVSGTTTIAGRSKFVIVFSEPMDTGPTSVVANGTVIVAEDTGSIDSTPAFVPGTQGRILVVTPQAASLPYDAGESVRLFLLGHDDSSGNGIRDLDGERLEFAGDTNTVSSPPDFGPVFRWTAGASDTTPPRIAERHPADGAVASPSTTIRLLFDEPVNPATASTLVVTDGGGTVSGTFTFDLDTLRGFTFTPARALAGTVSVDPSDIEDLSGNAVGGSAYTFTVGTDNLPPRITLLTVNGVPFHLNGGPSVGGGSPTNAGVLRVPPAGFTIDATFEDPGGSGVSTAFADLVLTCDRDVAGIPAGTNLVPHFPPGYMLVTATEAHFLVPESLPVPLGVIARVTLTVKDQAGNTSAARTFGFEAAAADPAVLALDGPADEWVLRFDRDFESATHSFTTWTTGPTNPGTEDTVAPDGRVDFDHDLEGFGLASAGGAGLVDGSATLTMNQAARNWVVNRVLYHLARAYGQAVDFDDGNPNPGFAAVRAPVPRAGAGGANVRFSFAEADPGTGVSQLGFGGLTAITTVLGRADFDGQNDDRSHDDGATSANAHLGIFTGNYLGTVYDGGPPNPLSLHRDIFDPLTPFSGGQNGPGSPGQPLGTHAEDAFVLSPTQDPSTFTGARAARYAVVLRALDAAARLMAIVAAHEIGHSLGLVMTGAPGDGLYGGLPEYDVTDDSPHIDLSAFYPGASQEIMAVRTSFEGALSPGTRFNELIEAYLRNQAIAGD